MKGKTIDRRNLRQRRNKLFQWKQVFDRQYIMHGFDEFFYLIVNIWGQRVQNVGKFEGKIKVISW